MASTPINVVGIGERTGKTHRRDRVEIVILCGSIPHAKILRPAFGSVASPDDWSYWFFSSGRGSFRENEMAPRALVWVAHEFLEMLPVAVFFRGRLQPDPDDHQPHPQATMRCASATRCSRLRGACWWSARRCWWPERRAFAQALRRGAAGLVDPPTRPLVYWVFVFFARLIEKAIEDWHGKIPFSETVAEFSWHRFAAIQIWLLVLFLIYVTFSELNQLLGEGGLYRVLFDRRSSDLRRSVAGSGRRRSCS